MLSLIVKTMDSSNLIRKAIFRNGGSLTWSSKILDTFHVFNSAEAKPIYWPIVITAAEKGYGKSTSFEYLAGKMPDEICVEGDIMSLFAVAMYLKELHNDESILLMTYTEFANSSYAPWTVKVPNKSSAYADIFAKYLGSNWFGKIRLCTAFRGISIDRCFVIVIVPNYYTYVENFETRRDAMLNGDGSASFKEHVAKTHITLSWSEFNKLNLEHLAKVESEAAGMKIVENDDNGDYFALTLDHALYVARSYDK